ncbi:putative sporulation protein YtxC [Clostridium sp. YIM B02505]|uniref:Sporulation protein YtxC n=1 Tax=Clostridium yunnanense TaxID=2800325 RepID=A0ABS1EIP8_9CLOT|nr:putative sporulation protein YtxC [Clostridium yunnanense]MBK1809242.1 putative sporulation protein YtxC [Clostridium yunnanense]
MLLLKLAYEGEQYFIEDIQNIRNMLKEKNITIGISESLENNTHFVKIFCDDDDYNDRLKSIIYLYISNILYRVVIDVFKKREMFEYLTDTYFFLKHDELLEVEEDIMSVLNMQEAISDETSVYCMNRINSIIEVIRACIEENDEININGFITFRMKELIGEIERIIDKVVEKYMVEKEYKEFIKLLKYFVDIQESRIEEVNIIIEDDGGYKITDSNGKDIFQDFVSDLSECKLGAGVNVEDVIISGLITNCPEKIIIHNRELCLNREFLDTISNVFEERVDYCDDCKICEKNKIKI